MNVFFHRIRQPKQLCAFAGCVLNVLIPQYSVLILMIQQLVLIAVRYISFFSSCLFRSPLSHVVDIATFHVIPQAAIVNSILWI